MSAAVSRRKAGALAAGLAVLLAALAFAAFGVWAAASAFAAPKRAQTAVMDAATAGELVIPAGARGEAEAATLRRVVGVLQGEGVALQTGSFKAAADARLVSITFDFEGPPAAMWRAVHEMETGSPALVLTHIHVVSRDQGAALAISADALAAWAPGAAKGGTE